MSCLSISGPPSGPPFPVSTPICSIGLPFYTAMHLINQLSNQSIIYYCTIMAYNNLKINPLYITNNCPATVQYNNSFIGRLGSARSFFKFKFKYLFSSNSNLQC